MESTSMGERIIAQGTGQQRPIWRVSQACAGWADAGSLAHECRAGTFIVRGVNPQPRGTLVELTVELPDGIQVDLRGWVRAVHADAAGLEIDGRAGSGLVLLERLLREEAERAPRPRSPTSYAVHRPRR